MKRHRAFPFRLLVRPLALCAIAVPIALAGCATSAIAPETRNIDTHAYWDNAPSGTEASTDVTKFWLDSLDDSTLSALAFEAIEGNYQLAARRAALEESRQAVVVSGADRLPQLSLGLDGARQKRTTTDADSYSEDYSASLGVNWELDIWGKLSDRQQQARLDYESQLAGYESARRQLAADVATAWYNVIAAGDLLNLFEQRLVNLRENLDIIESNYRMGLEEAVNVYLTRNEVAQQRAQAANQQQLLEESVIALQRLLGRYPSGDWTVDATLPTLTGTIPLGLPSGLITRRNDIRQAWAGLLSADSELAVAHKARFPSLSLVASGGDSAAALHELLDGGSLAWSLLGSLSQPLFSGGRLASQEAQARSRVQQAEQNYLDTVFSAFAEVETAISQEHNLKIRYQALLEAEENSTAAYELSLQQYQRGLSTYTTVLEAQRRAFDAQTNVIQLRNQLLQNRIALHLALGGEFSADPAGAGNP